MDAGAITQIATWLRGSARVLFITGAGISADSGLPTYRGVGGLYEGDDPEPGISIEQALSGHMMMTRPALCWNHIAQIERACRGARPNVAHEIIARLEQHLDRVVVLTQNVDGLHRVAGSTHVIDIHGDVHDLMCTRCSFRDRTTTFEGLAIPPKCPECSGLVRPDVVLFGELLPGHKYARLQRELAAGFDLIVSIGTTSALPYIAEPVRVAARAGVPTVEINPGPTQVSDVVVLKVAAGAAAALSAVWEATYSATEQ